jgi:hypothetical protein
MESAYRESAAGVRSSLTRSEMEPPVFRAALMRVPPADRDAWLDLVLGLDAIPDDGPELPRGCVPYLPAPVDALLRVVDDAEVSASDVFVDIGAGCGRAALLVCLLTGASAIGVEIQPSLVLASRELSARLNVSRFSVIEGDAALLTRSLSIGSVFFLYCPFGGERLEAVLSDLEPIAQAKPIRICCVDLPIAPRPWLTLVSASVDLTTYRSTFEPLTTRSE